MNKDVVWQFIIGALMLAVIFMLVRPGAPAAAAIEDVSTALAGLIGTATQYTVSVPGQVQTALRGM